MICKKISIFAIALAILSAVNTSQAKEKPNAFDVEHAWSKADVDATNGWLWPQYRGLSGNGLADDRAKPPTEWGEDKNLLWKTPIAGRAWSSPIVWGDRVWLTDADENGKEQRLVALSRSTGEVVYSQVIFRNDSVQPDYHVTNSYASSTPVTDGRFVYCHFGAYGTAAVDMTKTGPDSIVWSRRDLPCNHYRGPGSSPILFENSIIVHFDGYDQQYIVALNKLTGETLWKTDRAIDFRTDNGDMKKAFSTPTIIEVNGSLQVISPAAKAVESYEPISGKRVWFVNYDEHSSAIRPMFDGKLVYLSTGFSKAKMIAIDPTGAGDVTATHVKWTATRSVGSKPSALLYKGKIFGVEDRGVFTCLDAKTGDVLWQKRLGGDFSSSPIIAAGNIYAFDEQGRGYAISTEGEGMILAENKLDKGCMASPIVVNDCLIVRTTEAVYCFRNK